MKTKIVIAVLLSVIAILLSAMEAFSQNYTTTADGNWNSASRWNNTSGWGTNTPPTDGSHGSGTITVNNNMTLNNTYNTGSATLNLNTGKTLTIGNTMTIGGGSTVNISGDLVVNGDLILYSTLNILPGGTVTVNGKVTVYYSNYLIVGTNVNPPPYADLIVKGDLEQKSSGDVTLNRNARVAVFGSVKGDNGGGTILTVNNGAQMYVDGDIKYTGGSDAITNNNTLSPYGLYVNGTVSNTGGGASTTSNKANKATMNSTNAPFANWVNSVKGSTMPVTILFFEVSDVNRGAVVLKWATASEENFDYFVVESSGNGVDFTEAGRVSGHGTTKERHDYKFEVANPAIGKTYFRLKSVDFDKYTETFKVISATYEAAKEVKVFPNPVVGGNVNIDFNFQPTEEVTVSLTNITGTEVYRQTINGMENLMTLSVDPGTYIVKISSTEVSSVSRLQVR